MSRVMSIIESSGFWTDDPMYTVQNDPYSYHYIAELQGWTNSAAATWKLDNIYYIRSVKLWSEYPSSSYHVSLTKSATSLTTDCTLVS